MRGEKRPPQQRTPARRSLQVHRQSRTIRLNLELAKKPAKYLEYVLVHEMIHLLEPSHNQRFIALSDRFMPKWRFYQAELNRLPIGYGDLPIDHQDPQN